MTILVTGAGGTVGAYFPTEGFEHADRKVLDVTDPEAVNKKLATGRYRAVVHLAAATNLDRCEKEPEWAYRLNTWSPEVMAKAARRHQVNLIHVSTVGIFSGRATYTEVDPPDPVNVYAKTKWAGEQAVLRHLPHATVVRTAWVMGGGQADKKFVGKVRDRLVAGEPVKAVKDIVGSPTYARDLAAGIQALMEKGAAGVVHLTNSGAASRYDMVLHMKEVLGSSSVVEAVDASVFPLPAPRPPSEVSRSLLLPTLGLDALRPWKEALEAYLGE